MFHLIDSDNDLFILDKELSKGGLVAVDTEFRRRGKEEIDLSLIQVNDSEETFIIDCLKIGKYKNNCKFLSKTNAIWVYGKIMVLIPFVKRRWSK